MLTLKNEIPDRREDGRRESVVSYEWAFEYSANEEDEKSHLLQAVVVEAKWEDFVATYRGRPVKDAPSVNPRDIHELSSPPPQPLLPLSLQRLSY